MSDLINNTVVFFGAANGLMSSLWCNETTKLPLRVQDVTNLVGYVFASQVGAVRMGLAATAFLLDDDPKSQAFFGSQFMRGALQFFHCTKIQVALDVIRGGAEVYVSRQKIADKIFK